jgi:UDP-GlcNAc:undecaprenyl-phosphate GlcNAc-1-phosphate transferase
MARQDEAPGARLGITRWWRGKQLGNVRPGAPCRAALHNLTLHKVSRRPMLLFAGLVLVSAALVLVMIRVGALDHPVARSSHTRPTPKGGGVGIVAAFALGMIWVCTYGGPPMHSPALLLGLAAVLLGWVSFLDDLYDWPFLAKLAAQAAAAGVVLVGPLLRHHGAGPGAGVVFKVALLAGVLLFITNAVNFMDGLNGLASGSVAWALAAAAIAAPALAGPLGLPLVAGILGFLPFNYPRARIFMGDVGSQVCGFVAAEILVLGLYQARPSLVVPLALLPMLADVAFTLVRRARAGARLTQAHRGHLYQIANRAGMDAWRVTLVYWGMAAWGGALGLAAAKWPVAAALGVVPVTAVATILAAAPFGVWAIWVARRALRAGLTVW